MTNFSDPAASRSETASGPADSCFDFIVIGSGFAGSLIASILQSQNRSVAIVDRSAHPRFAIGESSTPAANLILSRLADRYQFHWLAPLAKYGSWQQHWPQITTGRKRGFSYFHHQPGRPFEPRPNHATELLAMASANDEVSDTQWLRSDVDAFFVRQAEYSGVRTFEQTEIVELSHRTTGWDLQIKTAGQSSSDTLRTISGNFLIDASGSGQFLSRRLHIEDRSDELHTSTRAIFAHVSGLPRWQELLERRSPGWAADHPFPCDHAALHHVLEEGWMWWLRFDSDVTSVGLTLNHRSERPSSRTSPTSEFRDIISRYPDLEAAFRQTRFSDSKLMPVRTQRLQRLSAKIVGKDWAMLPHTAGFIDPLHSTGISHSLAGVERLAAILLCEDTLNVKTAPGPDWKHHLLRDYASIIHEELTLIDQLVAGCYDAIAARSFRKFIAFTMCYFAAATNWEHRRLSINLSDHPARRGLSRDEFRRRFPAVVCADDTAFRETVAQLRNRLPHETDEDFEQLCRRKLTPFNRVGLFEPPIPNMYGATALPE